MSPIGDSSFALLLLRREVVPGRMFVVETGRMSPPRYVINFPTKRHWRDGSRIEDIESGLDDLARELRARNIKSVAIPALGSDPGGLQWFGRAPAHRRGVGGPARRGGRRLRTARRSPDHPASGFGDRSTEGSIRPRSMRR